MAKLVTVVQTYFSDGRYRNNRVEIQIPDEAAELFQDETILGGIFGMCTEETDENEVFEHSFVDDEED